MIASERQGVVDPSEQEVSLEQLITIQYLRQVQILHRLGLIHVLPPDDSVEASESVLGFVGIDGKSYRVPSLERVLRHIKEQAWMPEKMRQGFTRLSIVPFGLPLLELVEVYSKVLRAHAQTNTLHSTDGTVLTLDTNDPIYMWDAYAGTNAQGADVDGSLIYDQTDLEDPTTGMTKQEKLTLHGGFQILLLETTPDIPAEGKGTIIHTRKQLEANKTPLEYQDLLHTDPQYQHEQPLTPESWFTLAITHLEETNQQIDDYDRSGKICYLLGSTIDSRAPVASWHRFSERARLFRNLLGNRNPNRGLRTALNITPSRTL